MVSKAFNLVKHAVLGFSDELFNLQVERDFIDYSEKNNAFLIVKM